MIAEEIRSLLQAQPFRPFTVHLTDGKEVTIHNHDYAWLLPSGLQLHCESLEGKIHIINTTQISEVTYEAVTQS